MNDYVDVVLNVPLFQTFTYLVQQSDSCAVGKRCEVRFGNRKMTAIILRCFSAEAHSLPLPPEKIKPILRVLDEEPLLSDELIALSRWISSYYICPQGEALFAMLPAGRRETELPGFAFEESVERTARSLSDEQQEAITQITANTASQSDEAIHYLFGITGSGKTEVFLQCAEAELQKNRGVIYLVPEIGLTHQVIEAVVGRFGPTTAVLHSGLTPSQRLTEWKRIMRREALVIVGARSAVFAPVPNLGLIIIDEEHDSSYKSGNSPRYHARQVAMKRCASLGIPLVMGSATPSVEAWHLMNTKRIVRHNLTKRLSGGIPPKISVLNMTEQKNSGCISAQLEEHIRLAKQEGRQSILFLNRRGFTHFIVCNTCSHEIKCKNCSVSLTWHKSEKRLRCHYCGWSQEIPQVCPECGSLDIGHFGFGTEFIETEIASRFPGFSVMRIDTDTLTKKGELEEALNKFKSGSVDILLGTQMIAKGLNFPNVKLVGVINADTGLHLPDFRAAERTFALIVQVAGRAGRFFPDGEVFVQSSSPDRPAIALACAADCDTFYEQELAQRELLGFPPFSRLIRLVFRSKNKKLANDAAAGAKNIILTELRKKSEETVDVLGPAECPLAQIASNYRYQLLLRAKRIGAAQAACAYFITGYKTPAGLYIETDVDPVNLL